MSKLKEIIDYYFNIISLVLIIFLLSGIIYIIYNNKTTKKVLLNNNSQLISNNQTEISDKTKIKVDIKGAVKKTGVYELDSGSTVDDLIKLAGGLTKKATTENINLSRILENQMVIKISTKKQLKDDINNIDNTKYNECVCPEVDITSCKNKSIVKVDDNFVNNENNNQEIQTTNDSSLINETKLISINNASKEELMTLPGIGEAKAVSIIEYRSNNSFKTIDEIKNVSGIGEALYEKIKSYISI